MVHDKVGIMRRTKLLLFHLLIFCLISKIKCEVSENEIPLDESPEKETADAASEEVQPVAANVGDEIDNVREEKERKVEQIERLVPDFESMTLEEIYKTAVDTYLDEHWEECIIGFNHFLQRYKSYKNAVINCRRKCRHEASEAPPIFIENVEDLHFYEKKIRETLCLLNCNQDYRDAMGPQSLKRISREMEKEILGLKPYEYLHICYYQRNRFQEAANALFTYMTVHPKHEMNSKNLRYYLTLKEVDESKVKNLEMSPFLEYYMKGVDAYEEELYDEAAENFEKSLKLYMKSEDECRLYCEGSFEQGWHPEFTSSIANHFTYCLKCKRLCSQLLNNFNGDYQRELLPSHYNYLQFAYYKLGEIKSTCQAVESYLLFYPADETMLNNKEYYKKLPKVEDQQDEYFIARPEAVDYVKRQEYELRILRYIADEFTIIDARISDAKKSNAYNEKAKGRQPFGGEISMNESRVGNVKSSKMGITDSWRQSQTELFQGINVIAEEGELKGRMRYLAEGFLTETQCKSLIQLADKAAVEGDGYAHNTSPHSKFEKFEGLTLGRAALMVYFGLLEPVHLDLFLKATELARIHVEKHFNLPQTLYFTYTHLVCRSALPGIFSDGSTFSHEIHADNCLAIEKGVCLHQKPAFTWRNYSAIVYLNDDFEGGEFVFSSDPKAKTIESSVKPKCGRMVAFSADGTNLHGVRGIKKGKRCALALWFTLDERYIESERRLAYVILNRVDLKGPVNVHRNFSIPENYERILREKFREDGVLKLLLSLS
ncbi:prolyl 3-hydroxylase 2 [Fopius arisanus]|uniref:procollagen-proline 3-dioxygenase n=1 Tax=Fopius arisanus TaxID=64838 RepID=A0A9R1TW49_9HYME|nr:PREDICTED: prolyl 3-hydroxylase 2-like [Fopius arisanus]